MDVFTTIKVEQPEIIEEIFAQGEGASIGITLRMV